MRSRPRAATWMVTGFGAALALAATVILARGPVRAGVEDALFATARLSFLLFWPAYTGSPLASLFGGRFQALRRHGRELGLAFAAAQLVHLGLVGWLCAIGAAPSAETFVFFGIAVAFLYLIALFSIGRLQRALSARGWTLLRLVGMNYILYAFAVDFLRHPLGGGPEHVLFYLPFAALAALAPVLRVAAFALRATAGGRGPSLRAG